MREAQQRPPTPTQAPVRQRPAVLHRERRDLAPPGGSTARLALPGHDIVSIPLTPGSERRVQRISFTQRIRRAPADAASRDEPEAEEPEVGEPARAEGDRILGPEDEASSRDTISSTVTLVPTVAKGGTPGAGDFGTTGSSASLSGVAITAGTGSFTVAANLDLAIEWAVRSGTGPASQKDIAGDTDSDITKTNYPTVVSDLTPDASSDRGRPPRTMFWAEDLTIKHELFHTTQRSGPFGKARAAAIKTFLDGKTAATEADVRALLPMALSEGQRVFNAKVAEPATEGDAYADGAPSYQKRADAIKKRGDGGLY
jgi:hypothetical protein